MKIERVAIVGVGLIGGSIGLAALARQGGAQRGGRRLAPGNAGRRAVDRRDHRDCRRLENRRGRGRSGRGLRAGRRDRRAGSPTGRALPARHADHRRRQHQGGDRRRTSKGLLVERRVGGRRAFRRQPSVGRQREARARSTPAADLFVGRTVVITPTAQTRRRRSSADRPISGRAWGREIARNVGRRTRSGAWPRPAICRTWWPRPLPAATPERLRYA